MTANEKIDLARFLDCAADSLRGGYARGEREYRFSDDPEAELAPPAAAPPAAAAVSDDSLERVAGDVCSCTACSLCTGRNKAVPGEGCVQPLVMVIGEGPGADEDAAGRPFVGEAGRLLDKMLSAIGLSRETNCFIANVVKCRPPANRDPLPEETAACAPFLQRQIRLLAPKFILCAGRIAAQCLLKTGEPIGTLRGKFMELNVSGCGAIPLIATYHPSALLHTEELKRPAWEDLKTLKAGLGAY